VSDVAAGIEWAIGNGTHIISMSRGSDRSPKAVKDACNKAYESGIVVVAAAGNYRYTLRGKQIKVGTAVEYPARYDCDSSRCNR